MKALSVKQPYAQLIVENIKDIENRSQMTTFRGKVYIHASLKWHDRLRDDSLYTDDQFRNIITKLFAKEDQKNQNRFFKPGGLDNLKVGAIIGHVDIIDCVIGHSSIWEVLLPVMLQEAKENENI
ncbi:ASCH domain-containing protein [Flavobacterium cupreum]|uniref:ASCH domain-containing protein n=1 Tax=Flavobacterium cupreum TaxID=2133766 RepID=A0A434A2N8_9FLAO|nr:ASCH domain-containing protein [Flavobacterium cupreum]RUT68670.1 ASCH domain-containing protein [Flavobacterium cupreum]